MHNLELVLENETHNPLCDFVIPTDHLISARQPDLVIINKIKSPPNSGLVVLADHRLKSKENKISE